jgi:hypothetical protein
MESNTAIALAGIAATAVVGVAGAISSWVVSRDDRSNQRALAHEERVYDRRADVYLSALAKVDQQAHIIQKDIERASGDIFANLRGSPAKRFPSPTTVMAGDSDARLNFRLIAFGSPAVVAAYADLHTTADDLYDDEINQMQALNDERNVCRDEPPVCRDEPRRAERRQRETLMGRVVPRLERASKRFKAQTETLQRLVQRELS